MAAVGFETDGVYLPPTLTSGRGTKHVWKQDVHHRRVGGWGRGREKQNCFHELRKLSFTMSRSVWGLSVLPSAKREKKNILFFECSSQLAPA